MEDIPIGMLIKQLHDSLEKQANNDLRSKDLTMMQLSILQTLHRANEKRMSMKELEHYFQIAQPTVTGIVSRLEQKGLVEAFGNPADKRIKVVHISPNGETCCKEAVAHMQETEERLVYGLSSAEIKMLNTLLSKLLENIR